MTENQDLINIQDNKESSNQEINIDWKDYDDDEDEEDDKVENPQSSDQGTYSKKYSENFEEDNYKESSYSKFRE